MRRKKSKVDERINSFLGKEALFEGTLTFEGAVRIDGRFKGEVLARSGNLIIGNEGIVNADIHAASVICSGEIRGKITAENRVNIQVPGKVFGDICAPTVIIEEGVQFEGNCKTTPPGKNIGQADNKDLRSVSTIKK